MEQVHFIFLGKQGEIQTEMPRTAIEQLFLGKQIYVPREEIVKESVGLPDEAGAGFTVAGHITKDENGWRVPVKQQMASTNRR